MRRAIDLGDEQSGMQGDHLGRRAVPLVEAALRDVGIDASGEDLAHLRADRPHPHERDTRDAERREGIGQLGDELVLVLQRPGAGHDDAGEAVARQRRLPRCSSGRVRRPVLTRARDGNRSGREAVSALPERDMHCEVRAVVGVLPGAVDGIDDPAPVGLQSRGVVLGLLREDGVARELLTDPRQDPVIGHPIGELGEGLGGIGVGEVGGLLDAEPDEALAGLHGNGVRQFVVACCGHVGSPRYPVSLPAVGSGPSRLRRRRPQSW